MVYKPRKAFGNPDRLKGLATTRGTAARPSGEGPPSGLPPPHRPTVAPLGPLCWPAKIRWFRIAAHLGLGCYVATEIESVPLRCHEQPHQSLFSMMCVVYSACDGALPLPPCACLACPHWLLPCNAVRSRAPASFTPRACTPPSKRINLLGEFTTKIFNLTSH